MNTCRSDLCAQGRKACPTPTACEVASDPDQFDVYVSSKLIVAGALALIFFFVAAAGFLAGLSFPTN